jgi:hypothetical protein
VAAVELVVDQSFDVIVRQCAVFIERPERACRTHSGPSPSGASNRGSFACYVDHGSTTLRRCSV